MILVIRCFLLLGSFLCFRDFVLVVGVEFVVVTEILLVMVELSLLDFSEGSSRRFFDW